ncbi:MAG: ABC transporter permease [Clostridia bacterium]|nr:ABC transporter permease [Clostridia bacterium]
MELFFGTTVNGLQNGLCFAVLALGVYISFSVLDFPDLSVDGTFPLGGVVSTVLMLRLGVPPLAAICLSFFAGALAGAVTGVLHVKFKISALLSGIIVMTSLLSVNLALTKLLTENGYTTTIFSYRSAGLAGIFGGELANSFGKEGKDYMIIAVLLLIVLALKVLIDLFFRTKMGYMLRAVGDNERLAVTLAKNAGAYKIFGLALANGFVAVSGAVYSQLYMSYDNNCGSGKAVLALASVIIGTAVFANIRFLAPTTAVVLGAVIYGICINYIVIVDENGIYTKLLNAVLFAMILIFNEKISAFLSKRGAMREEKKRHA